MINLESEKKPEWFKGSTKQHRKTRFLKGFTTQGADHHLYLQVGRKGFFEFVFLFSVTLFYFLSTFRSWGRLLNWSVWQLFCPTYKATFGHKSIKHSVFCSTRTVAAHLATSGCRGYCTWLQVHPKGGFYPAGNCPDHPGSGSRKCQMWQQPHHCCTSQAHANL